MKFIHTVVGPALQLLNSSYRKKSLTIILLMVFQAFMDFLNITAFFPLFALIVKPESISFFSGLQPYLRENSQADLILWLSGLILFFTILKTFIVWKITLMKANFAFGIAHNLSLRIISNQLQQEYLQFAQTDFSKEINRAANLPLAFANNIIIALTTLVSEGIVCLLIILGISWVNFQLLFSVLLILVPLGSVYLMNRKKIKQISLNLKVQYPQSLKLAAQSIESWLEIKAYQKEAFFSSRYKRVSEDLARIFSGDHSTQIYASRLTELFATFIICSILFWSVISHQQSQHVLLMLAIYVGASFRLLPSFNRIFNALLQIKSHEYLLEELKPALNTSPWESKENTEKISFKKSIVFEHVAFAYPNSDPLFEVQLEIKKGDKVAFIGKSGNGKTSLLLLLLGILRPSAGKILIDDVERVEKSSREYQLLFSYVSQQPAILDASIKENVAFGVPMAEMDLDRIRDALRQVDLLTLIDSLAEKMDTQIGEKGIRLSGGQRQRLAIARALYADREILVLDEVTNQLDSETESEIIQTLQRIAQQNRTIVMVTHHEELFPLFDRILKLENGRLMDVTTIGK